MNRRSFLKGSGALVVSFSMARVAQDLGLTPGVLDAHQRLERISEWLRYEANG